MPNAAAHFERVKANNTLDLGYFLIINHSSVSVVILSCPDFFVSVQAAANSKFRAITKDLFDSVNGNFALPGLTGSLPQLYTEGFDEEQIWQQLELHNEPSFKILMKNVAKLLTGKDKKLSFYKVEVQADEEEEDVQNGKEHEEEEDKDSVTSDLSFELPADSEDENSSDLDETADLKLDEYRVLDEEREERPNRKRDQPIGKIRKTEVDDQFFKVGEMEKFLEKEEAEKPKVIDDDDEEEDIDFFEDIPSEDEENVI